MTEDVCKNYKHAAEYYMEINGGISDPDILLRVPDGQWKDSMSDQIIFQTGYAIRCDPSDEEMQRSMDRLLRLIQTRPLSSDHMRHIVNALNGYWDGASSGLRETIESMFGSMILHLIDQSVSDRSLMSAMRRSNPEMLERILWEAPGGMVLPARHPWEMRQEDDPDSGGSTSRDVGDIRPGDIPSADGGAEFEVEYT